MFAVDLFDDGKNLLDDKGRQPQGGFVQEQEAGAGHERPGDGEHLLFAAAQSPAFLMPALGENREEGKDVFEILAHRGPVAAQIGADIEVLQDRELGEDMPPFRHLTDTPGHDPVRRQTADLLAVKDNAPRHRPHHPGNRHQGRGLAGAVAADQGDDLALVHREPYLVEGGDIAVCGADAVQFKHNLTLRDRRGSPEDRFESPRGPHGRSCGRSPSHGCAPKYSSPGACHARSAGPPGHDGPGP